MHVGAASSRCRHGVVTALSFLLFLLYLKEPQDQSGGVGSNAENQQHKRPTAATGPGTLRSSSRHERHSVPKTSRLQCEAIFPTAEAQTQ